MTSKERFLRMYNHQEADRVPITDVPWSSTLERWHGEGMPRGVNWLEVKASMESLTIKKK